jgi:hypothetical protein
MSKNKTYHIVYQITNLINDKIYIGKHSTNDLNDGYMSSSKALNEYAFEKYGIENFKKEYISFHDSEEEAYIEEELIVDEDFVKRRDTYNFQLGGRGGCTGMVSVKNKDGGTLKVLLSDPRYLSGELIPINKGRVRADDVKKAVGEKIKNKRWIKNTSTGESIYINSEEVEEYIKNGWEKGRIFDSSKNKTANLGKKQKKSHTKNIIATKIGRVYIYNTELKRNKIIKPEELESYLNDGWVKGRKLKWD